MAVELIVQLGLRQGVIGKPFLGDFVAPLAEGALGEFHDIALMHQGDTFPAVVQGIGDGTGDQAFGIFGTNRFDADARILRQRNLHFLDKKTGDPLGLRRLRRPFNAGVQVFGVFTENDHVDLLGMLHRARNRIDITHRTNTGVKVQLLANGNVDTANALADRCRKRPLDGHTMFLDQVQGFFRQPLSGLLIALLARIDFPPNNFSLALKRSGNRQIDDLTGCVPDIGANPVALDHA